MSDKTKTHAGDRQHVPTDQAAPDALDIAIVDLVARTRDDDPWTAFDVWDHDNQPNEFDGHVAEILNAVFDGRSAPASVTVKDCIIDVIGGKYRAIVEGDDGTLYGVFNSGDNIMFSRGQVHLEGLHILSPKALENVISSRIREASAPAEVEGLVERLLWPHNPASEETVVPGWCIELFAEAATALTALQAENERLRLGSYEIHQREKAALARAEKAEAERDAWKANAEALAEAAMRSRELTSLACDEGFNYKTGDWVDPMFKHNGVISHALTTHAKLKGDV